MRLTYLTFLSLIPNLCFAIEDLQNIIIPKSFLRAIGLNEPYSSSDLFEDSRMLRKDYLFNSEINNNERRIILITTTTTKPKENLSMKANSEVIDLTNIFENNKDLLITNLMREATILISQLILSAIGLFLNSPINNQ